MEEAKIRIEDIDHNSKYLEVVIALGRTNAKTLGYMPKGAFVDYAMKRHIIIALSSDNECVGYLMYRITSQPRWACIAHLCVEKAWRGKHVASQLISNLIHNTRSLYGIKLTCRRDYNLSNMWSSFGFVARTDKLGKNKYGREVTIWQLEHKHPELLTILMQQELESKLCAVMDANIFYDLDEQNINRQTEDSKSLMADWLQSEVELCLTDEIDNEINRFNDSTRRENLRDFASKFTQLSCAQEDFGKACQAMRKYFPEELTVSDASDFRHLARSVAANAQFFITRDQKVLDKEEIIYEEFKISILRPSDLIIRLDELRREADYQPIRLAGTSIERRLAQAGQQNIITQSFLFFEKRETKIEFKKKLRSYLTEPSRFECFIVWDEQEEPLALVVYDREQVHELKIPMLRIRRNYILSFIVLRHLILLSIKIAAQEKRSFTKITDSYLADQTIKAIVQDNFVNTDQGWIRVNIAVIKTAFELSNYLKSLTSKLGQEYYFCFQFTTALEATALSKNVQLMADIERSLYPAKIIDVEIPIFIVPIRPEWAENLFDEELAKQNLFGAKKELALRRELVYYRAARNSGGLKAPGRILWYVSQGKKAGHYYQVQSIRACSRLDEIIIDSPKHLFHQFRRLGIYTFKDILETAKNGQGKLI